MWTDKIIPWSFHIHTLKLHQQRHGKMADCTPSPLTTVWNKEVTWVFTLWDGVVQYLLLLLLGLCRGSGEAGRARGEEANTEQWGAQRNAFQSREVWRASARKSEGTKDWQEEQETQAARKLLTIFKKNAASPHYRAAAAATQASEWLHVCVCVFFTANWQPELPILTSGLGLSGW